MSSFERIAMGCAALLCASMLAGCATTCAQGMSPIPVYMLDASFPRPSGVFFDTVSWVGRDPASRLIYVLQRAAPPVSVWQTDGTLVSSWSTQTLGDPHSISFQQRPDGSTVAWITDMAPPQPAGQGQGHCLKAFTMTGTLLSTIGTCAANSQGSGLDPVQFDKVTDIAWDAAGEFIVTDGDVGGLNNRVLKLNPQGKVLKDWSAPGNQPGSGPAQFNLPHAVLVDRCDRMWIADALNHRVQVIGSDGAYHGALTTFGELGVYALAFGAPLSSASNVLFVGASPSTGGGTGTVSLFAAPMDCAHPDIANLQAFASFDVPVPTSTSTTLLHAMAVDPDTWDVYLAFLGGQLAPQKWRAIWPSGKPPGAH